VPDWAVPVEYGQASLWVGSATVPVPPVGTKPRHAEPLVSAPPPLPPPPLPPSPLPPPPPSPAAEYPPGVDAGRSGPLADALIRDTVSALHAELEQRSGRETALGIALEQSRAELAARAAAQGELEATLAELRAELGRLAEAVTAQQAEFERQLTDARERFEAELAEGQSKLGDGARELDAARSELVDAHANADRARSELELARVEREQTVAELAQARGESDRARAELASAREHEAGHVHTRERLADVNDRLTAAMQSDQLRAAEASSLREQLAAAQISRDAAIAEAGGLRSELARLGSELAFSREHADAVGGDLGEAQQLLEDARALSAQLRGSGTN
jgi:chromosome segregation ATPase